MMTAAQRAEFLRARSQGLGGSDAASILQEINPETGKDRIEVKYACRRRLGLDKARVPVDFEREETGPMRLGNILEPILCEDFAKATGRHVEVVGRQVHPEHPELGGHTDRMQLVPERAGRGPLECKALGTRIFYETKRLGLLVDYELQLQFYCEVTTSDFGSFIVGNRDNLEILYWDVERNADVCEALVRKGIEFWKDVGNLDKLAPKLEPDDPRCGRCEYRLRCHGVEFIPAAEEKDIPVLPDLSAFALEYIERRKLLDEAEELVAETKEILMVMLGDKQAVHVPVNGVNRPIYWRPQDGKPLYADAVKNMSAQYMQMRDTLIQIQTAITDPNARDVDGVLQRLAAGAELIPVPAAFIKKGKPSRPLMLQYLAPKPKGNAGE